MAKILLCNPLFLSQNEAEQKAKSPYFPMGLLYLASYLRENGHAVAMFDGTFQPDAASFVETLHTEQPDIVGLTLVLPNQDSALHLATLAHDFGAVVIMGGPDATRSPQTYLAHPQVDLIVHHEGEETLLRLLTLFEQSQLAPGTFESELGIAYRDTQGHPVLNPPRPYIENLDDLPTPARDLVDMDKYLETWRDENGYASMTISTTRGCPYGCEWCQDAVHGGQLRQRSPASVAAEVKQLKETFQIDRLRVIDDVDGLSREWLAEWAEEAKKQDAVVPFEALNDLARQDIPMLDVRDTL